MGLFNLLFTVQFVSCFTCILDFSLTLKSVINVLLFLLHFPRFLPTITVSGPWMKQIRNNLQVRFKYRVNIAIKYHTALTLKTHIKWSD